ncbi:unnamed protein product [Sphagnum balticum]
MYHVAQVSLSVEMGTDEALPRSTPQLSVAFCSRSIKIKADGIRPDAEAGGVSVGAELPPVLLGVEQGLREVGGHGDAAPVEADLLRDGGIAPDVGERDERGLVVKRDGVEFAGHRIRVAGLAGTVVRLSTRLFVASSSAPRLPKHFPSPRKSEGVRCGLLQVYYLAASSSTSCRTTLP